MMPRRILWTLRIKDSDREDGGRIICIVVVFSLFLSVNVTKSAGMSGAKAIYVQLF